MGVAAGLLLPAAAARIPDREVEEGGWGPTIFFKDLDSDWKKRRNKQFEHIFDGNKSVNCNTAVVSKIPLDQNVIYIFF